jgi:hypothetical protein
MRCTEKKKSTRLSLYYYNASVNVSGSVLYTNLYKQTNLLKYDKRTSDKETF